MTTTRKLAGIALIALVLLTARWAVSHTYTLILWGAILSTVAVVAGPTLERGRKAITKNKAPKDQPAALPPTTPAGDIDWSAIVLNTPLHTDRKDA